MKSRFRKKNYWIVALLACLTLVFAGCRPSPVLEQIIYTQTATVVDVDHQKLEQDKRHGEEDDRFNDENEGDSSGDEDVDYVNENNGGSAEHEEQDLGISDGGEGRGEELQYSQDAGDYGAAEGQAAERAMTPEATPDPTSTPTPTPEPEEERPQENPPEAEDDDGGLEEYDPEAEPDPEDPGNDTEEPEDPDDPGNDPGNDEDPQGGEPDPYQGTDDPENTDDDGDGPGGDDGGDGDPDSDQPKKESEYKTINYGGIEQEVPINADTVTACGYAAQFVEMLGGSGRLIGCDSDFWYNELAYGMLADFEYVYNWWDGDGSLGIGNNEFQELINAFPDAVFAISGDYTFTQDQVSELKKLGIGYVVVPRPSSLENIINGAKIVATVLTEDANGADSMSIAERYESWAYGIQSEVNAGDLAVYSTYLSDWRDDISYWFTSGNYWRLPVEPEGSGYGVATGYSAAAKYPVTEYLNAAGVTNEAAQTGSAVSEEEVIVAPMFHNLGAEYSFNGSYAAYDGSLPQSADWGLAHRNGELITRLGDDNFKYVIAADNYVKDNIDWGINWYWQWHGVVKTSTGIFNYAYVDTETRDVFWSSICGDYEVLVSPYGFANWAKGSADSPLLSYWAACYIRGAVSEDSLYQKIGSFYNEFYGVRPDDGTIAAILGGE